MKKLSALLLSLLLLLTACGTPATPGAAVTLPTPNDEILVDEGLHAEDLPRSAACGSTSPRPRARRTRTAIFRLPPVPTRARAITSPSACRTKRTPISFRRASLPMRASRLPISPAAGRSRRAPTVSSRGTASCTTPSPSPQQTAPSRTSPRRTAASSVWTSPATAPWTAAARSTPASRALTACSSPATVR